jgi:hypothetical protein
MELDRREAVSLAERADAFYNAAGSSRKTSAASERPEGLGPPPQLT